MNKILRKCREFGLIIRLTDISTKESLKCVRSLKKGNIPLCLIDSNINGWELILREIAFNEDLFIGTENIRTIEDAYLAAGNGAQFFILNNSDPNLMSQLKNAGFFFIPKVSTLEELTLCNQLQLECIFPESEIITNATNLYIINESNDPYQIKHNEKTLFTIINLNDECKDYELWINEIVNKYLGFDFTEVYINRASSNEIIEFGEIFAAIHKSKIIESNENSIVLMCNNFNRTISYLKWKNLFINPNDVNIINNNIVQGHLDLKLGDFKIIIKERGV